MYRFTPEQLRNRRGALGIRRERIGVELDRSVETIRFWERGRAVPNAHQIAQLANLLKCSPADFYLEESA